MGARFNAAEVRMLVYHYWFDWIFFAIVGIPWVLALVQAVAPDWLEPLIKGRNPG